MSSVHRQGDDTEILPAIGFMQQQVDYIKKKITEVTDMPELNDVLSSIQEPFWGLSTEYQQTKYFRQNFQLLVCV